MSTPKPPQIFVQLFKWYCRGDLQEAILGDIEEEYDDDFRAHGKKYADRRFVWTVIRFFRPSIIMSARDRYRNHYYGMLGHYLKNGRRSLLKHKTSSVLNVLGLTIGMASCLIILQYVAFEASYDQFHSRKDDIYRLDTEYYREGVLQGRYVGSGYLLGPTIRENVVGIQSIARVHQLEDGAVLTYRGEMSSQARQFFEDQDQLYFVDQDFFDLFDYKVLRGNRTNLLTEPRSMVITEAMWQKYMPDVKDPLGEFIEVAGGRSPGRFQVTGVIETLPQNTMYSFGFLMPMQDLLKSEQYMEDDGWGWTNFTTYVLTESGANVNQVAELVKNTLEGRIEEESDRQSYVALAPLDHLHLDDKTRTEGMTARTLSFFVLIAAFIIAIAWLNYINLATAQAFRRAREVGIRKAIGAAKRQLIWQFLTESVMINMLALVAAVVLTYGTLPILTDYMGKSFQFGFAIQRQHWLLFVTAFLIGTLLSGLYPAFVLARMHTNGMAGGVSSASGIRRKFGLRQVLVTAQLMIGILLITATYSVHRQLHFMLNQELGLQVDQVVSITSPSVYEDEEIVAQKMKLFQSKLSDMAAVSHVSVSDAIPGGGYNWTTRMSLDGDPAEEKRRIRLMFVDDQFHHTYGMELLAGQFHSRDFSAEEHQIVVNETLVEQFGLGTVEEAIGKRMRTGETTLPIIGVMKDYHWASLRWEKMPMLLYYSESGGLVSVRLSTRQVAAIMDAIEDEYTALFPGNPFEYDFMDDFFARQYESDRRFGQLFSVFSLVAVLIACLGLFGLASFTIYQRTKEISIRKVLGARIASLLMLLYKDYMALIVLAAVVMFPLAYVTLDRWLEDFAYRIRLTPDLFVLPLLALAMITILTISYQSFRAASSNPATMLRKE